MPESSIRTYADLSSGEVGSQAWQQRLVGSSASEHLVVQLAPGDRIHAAFIGALILAEQDRLRQGGSLRVTAGDEEQRTLLRLAGCERLLTASAGFQPLDLSCLLRCAASGESEIHVQVTALQNARLSLPGAYAWMRRLESTELTINLEELPHINSVLVAWILQISQAAKPAPLTLHNVARQVNIQLMQLRLHHLLSVKTAD